MNSDDSNRVALSLIVNDKDDILFGRRKDNGKYTVAGGHIKKGENPYNGMTRELKEETGLDALDLKMIKASYCKGKIIYLFKILVDPKQEIDPNGDPDEECEFWSYMDPNDAVHNLHVKAEDNIVLKYWAYETD